MNPSLVQPKNFQVFFGPPGTGKTTTLSRLVSRYAEYEGADTLLLTSFTKAAAHELAGRDLALAAGSIGTLHSHCFQGLDHPTIAQSKAAEWNAAFPRYPMSAGSTASDVNDSAKSTAQHSLPDERAPHGESLLGNILLSAYDLLRAALQPLSTASPAVQLFVKHYEAWKYAQGYLDFTDLLTHGLKHLRIAPGRPRTLIVDEAQDLSPLQWALITQWSQHAVRTIAGGDDDQCQPAGTMVSTPHGLIDIADLDPAHHTLLTYAIPDARIYGYKKPYHFTKTVRPYYGRLHTIIAAEKTTRCTPNHQWVVRWDKARTATAHIIYLMRQGERFRVGWCKLFRQDGTLHLGVRAHLEKADAAWILRVTESRTEASIYEQVCSVNYGIPTITFRSMAGAAHMTMKAIDSLFAQCKELPRKAEYLLEAHAKTLAHPLWSQAAMYAKQGGSQIFQVHASNLEPQVMLVPVQSTTQAVAWHPFTVQTSAYAGEVYSLDVAPHHTYIADGIITHNCLYRWAGADAGPLLAADQASKSVLPKSYRLPNAIFDYAQQYLQAIQTREPKTWTSNGLPGEHIPLTASWRNPESLRPLIEHALAVPARTFLVLAPCSYMLEHIVSMLRHEGIPFANPWRRRRGDWNPLFHGGRGISSVTRLLDFLRDPRRLWTWRELGTWGKIVRKRHNLLPGAESLLIMHEDEDTICPLAMLEKILMPDALQGALNGGISWLETHILKQYAPGMTFPLRVYRRFGRPALAEDPRIMVGTCHSVKGGEADEVVLFRELSRAFQQARSNGGDDADGVERMLYVGATRARHVLYTI